MCRLNRWVACGLVLLLAGHVAADVIGFVDNEETNSVDWREKIAELGGEVNEDVNFDTHPNGGLLANHYAGIGVTIQGTGSISQVVTGAGPGQGNISTPPKSDGEGLHPPSNHVRANAAPGTFTVSFDQQVTGAGMFLVDLFNPNGVHPVKLTAYTGPNGTGDLLGSFNAAGFNFQKNFMYFMGVVSTDGDIGSIRITVTGGAGDVLGLDDVLFAGGGSSCTYTIKKSKAKGGCESCPKKGSEFKSEQRCEKKSDCRKRVKTKIGCPDGNGSCKIKAKKRKC